MSSFQKFFNFWNEDRGVRLLMISISLLMFVMYPLAGNSEFGAVVTNLFVIISLFSGILTIDVSVHFRKLIIGFLIIILLLNLLADLFDNNSVTHIHLISRIIFLMLLIVLIFIRVFGNSPITYFYRIAGSVTIYLLIGFIWANIYYFFYLINPDSFKMAVPFNPEDNMMFNFIYYSFENLTTLGYGDILPLTPWLKTLVILEAILGPLYMAVLIGRLISSRRMFENSDSNTQN